MCIHSRHPGVHQRRVHARPFPQRGGGDAQIRSDGPERGRGPEAGLPDALQPGRLSQTHAGHGTLAAERRFLVVTLATSLSAHVTSLSGL